MNTEIQPGVLGTLTVEIDKRFSPPAICIGQAGPRNGYIWLTENDAVWLRDWLERAGVGKDGKHNAP